MPTTTFIIPCFKQAQFLPDAVASLLSQTVADWELVIASGCDDCTAVARRYESERVRILTGLSRGQADARNHAVDAARGRYIVPLDADDKLDPTFLQKALCHVDATRTNLVSSYLQMFGHECGTWVMDPYSPERILDHNQLCVTTLYDKKLWASVGGYDTSLPGYEDWEFWIRCSRLDPHVFVIPEFLFFYRQHDNNGSKAWGRHAEACDMIRTLHPDIYGYAARESALRLREASSVARAGVLRHLQWFPNSRNAQALATACGLELSRPPTGSYAPHVELGSQYPQRIRLLADAIHETLGVREALDIGCGEAMCAARLAEHGWTIRGAEGSEDALRNHVPTIDVFLYDASRPFNQPDRPAEVVICTETAEHIDAEHADNVVGNVSINAKDMVVWAAAKPGQHWPGHVNLQPRDYWLRKFSARGWTLDASRTQTLRFAMTRLNAQHAEAADNFCVLVREWHS